MHRSSHSRHRPIRAQVLRTGQVTLKLRGHAIGSYQALERRFGPPIPLQRVPPRADEPGFATWLIRFHLHAPLPVASAAASVEPPPVAMVRLLGRYSNYDQPHAWLIEGSASGLADAVRVALSIGGKSPAKPAQYSFDIPPPAFHAPNPTSIPRRSGAHRSACQ